jgi:PAS domain-containing protein
MHTFPLVRDPEAITIDSRRKLRGREVCLACLHVNGRLELITGEWERLLGYPRAALHGMPLARLLPAADVRRLLDPDEHEPIEVQARMRDGTPRHLRVYRRFEARAPSALYLACEPFSVSPDRMSRASLSMSALSIL